MIRTALYIHIPFCEQRCTYCDFASSTDCDRLIQPYVGALCSELALLHTQLPEWEPSTVYVGGGTPTVLPPGLIGTVLTTARPFKDAEITLEANPGTVSRQALRALRTMGFNRLSLGMQSSDSTELGILGRRHDQLAVRQAVGWARDAGFENISLDLIYGLPAQKIGRWERSLDAALVLEPEHLSLYCLSLEPGTPLADAVRLGRLPSPDPDLAADMYELGAERLAHAGYHQYEISNWARPGRECRHNLAYWRNESYVGSGAGAWGHWRCGTAALRMCNVSKPGEYIDHMTSPGQSAAQADAPAPRSPACAETDYVTWQMAMAETMFMGLRLVEEGVSRHDFRARFGVDPTQLYEQVLERLALTGLVGWDENRIFLRPAALLIANQVFAEFLPDVP